MKLSFALFCKNLLLNLLIAVQICASTLSGVIAIAVIEKAFLYYNITECASSSYLYMPENEDVYYTESAIAEFSDSGEINLARTRVENVWAYNTSVKDAYQAYLLSEYKIDKIHTFGPIISDVMKTQLKNGRWYSDEADDYIECVIVGNESMFPIGAIIDGAEYDVKVVDKKLTFAIKNKYRFKVVGTCGARAQTLDFTLTSKPADLYDLEKLFTTVSYEKASFFENLNNRDDIVNDLVGPSDNKSEKPSLTIYCSAKAFYGNPLGNCDKNHFGLNALFTFADNVSIDRQNEILSQLKCEAGVTDVASARDRALLKAKNTVAQYLPIMLCFVAMAIVGAICVAVLNMIKNENTFKVYFNCGMSTKRGMGILAMYLGILLIIAALLTLLSWTVVWYLNLLPKREMILGASSILYAFANYVVAAVLILVSSIPILKHYEKTGEQK